jgi:hypothetical protein
MTQRLQPGLLAALPAGVRRPAFDRKALRPGIVHLGHRRLRARAPGGRQR